MRNERAFNRADSRFLVGRIAAPKHVHMQILRTHEYVSLHGKKDFADLIKIKDFKMNLIWVTQEHPIESRVLESSEPFTAVITET